MTQSYYTYILYSESHNKLYIGQTSDIFKRVQSHNSGLVRSTKPYRPYKLLWYEIQESRSRAMARERKLKNLKSRRRIREYIVVHGEINDKEILRLIM